MKLWIALQNLNLVILLLLLRLLIALGLFLLLAFLLAPQETLSYAILNASLETAHSRRRRRCLHFVYGGGSWVLELVN